MERRVVSVAWLVLLTTLAMGVAGFEQTPFNPVANPSAVVKLGGARFTILTPSLIRNGPRGQNWDHFPPGPEVELTAFLVMEYSTGSFEDRPTWAVLNRYVASPPQFTTRPSGSRPGWTEIRTSSLSIQYNPSGGAFSANNLVVVLLNPVGKTANVTWMPGMANSGNLLGTIRSLDEVNGPIAINCTQNVNVSVHGESLHCAWGLISRDGWVLMDDTRGPYLDQNEWPMNQTSADVLDWYFFGHGHNYKQSLQDYTLIGLQMPMTPKYTHGIMWSRWYWISSSDLPLIVDEYISRSMPLDVFIIDMDWHMSEPYHSFNMSYYWTGWTWDPHFFPSPSDAIGYLKESGLHVGVNIHDETGVQSFEKQYSPMALANGIDPSTGQKVPFDVTDPHYMETLHDIVMQPLMEDGVDFWWIDWQQGGTDGVHINNVNPTYMTNWYRATREAALVGQGKNTSEQIRGWVLSRWGGMGNHRYQTGFSGDVWHTWSSLAFQPYFTSTAANVGYGYWSHDISGGGLDYEMSTRWIQWGAVSPLFRTHDAGMAEGFCADMPGECSLGNCNTVEVWNVPNYNFEINRKALRLRASWLPIFYTLHRIAYEKGLGPVRPMYYNFPEIDAAYNVPNQYNLGDDLIVAPVVVQADATTKLSTMTVWLPPGTWIDRESGALRVVTNPDGLFVKKSWDLSEIPVYVRGGAVLPSIPESMVAVTGNANRQYPALTWTIYPGTTSGVGRVYDDDGITMGYQSGQFAWSSCTFKRVSNTTYISLSMDQTFPTQLTVRPYTVKLINDLPPAHVFVNGTEIPFSKTAKPGFWSFDPIEVAVVVSLGAVYGNNTQIVLVSASYTSPPLTSTALSGVKGSISRARLAKTLYDDATIPRNDYPSVLQARETGYQLSLQANNTAFVAQVLSNGAVKTLLTNGDAEMKAIKTLSKTRKIQAVALLDTILAEIQSA